MQTRDAHSVDASPESMIFAEIPANHAFVGHAPMRKLMDRLLCDVRIALRGFRRTPAFTAAVLGVLALGIGMASTMAAVTDAVLRRPLPVVAPEIGRASCRERV